MANYSSSVPYTGRDVAEIRRTLIEMIPSLTDKWTDFNESDLGVVLIELIAGAQDMQNFYFDTQAYETFLDTAVQDKNVRSLLRSMNYHIPLTNSCKGSITITFQDSEYKEISIPKYTKVFSSYADQRQQYLTADAFTREGEFSSIEIPIIEGELKTLVMTKQDFENNKNSSSNTSRRVYLGFKNVAEGSVVLEQDDVIWEQCDDALLKYRGGYFYSVHKDSEGQVYVMFPPDYLERIPQVPDETVTFKFILSNGFEGQVPPRALNQIGITLPYQVTEIVNNRETYGGADEPVLTDLKVLAREHAVTMDRYITVEDYKNGVDTEPYVFQSIVKDWKSRDFVSEPYLVKVWAVDHYGKSVGEENAKSLAQKLESRGNLEVSVQVMPVETLTFDVEIDVTTRARTTEDKESVKKSIQDDLAREFNINNMYFGKLISFSMITSVARQASPYIKQVYVKAPVEDIELYPTQFPALGKVIVNIIDNQ